MKLQAVTKRVLQICRYPEDELDSFSQETEKIIWAKTLQKTIISLPSIQQEEVKNAFRERKYAEAVIVLRKYVPVDKYTVTFQEVAMTTLKDMIQEIIADLSNTQRVALRQYFESLIQKQVYFE